MISFLTQTADISLTPVPASPLTNTSQPSLPSYTNKPTRVREELLQKLVTVLCSPEDFMRIETARTLFPPYDVPKDTMDGEHSEFHLKLSI
jgi:hypothetical protein